METTSKSDLKKISPRIRMIMIGLIAIIALFVICGSIVFFTTPYNLRYPQQAHHHFRMQLFVDGEYIDFSKPPYQEVFEPGLCSTDLTDTPIHFHDQKDQFVHIHWDKMRGGDVLKYYGFNRLGGLNNSLGYRFDKGGLPRSISVLTDGIPDSQAPMHVYVVNQQGEINKKDAEDFLYQDLETFFGVKSSLTLQREEAEAEEQYMHTPALLYSQLSVYAHNDTQENSDHTQEELKKLNDLIGDVIIFIQENEPTQEQVQERVPYFISLDKSQCGG